MNRMLIESQYIGTCSYWKLLLNAPEICFDKQEHYVKRSYRNRAHILSANDVLRLSIPLESGKNQHSAMKDVRISYKEDWQSLHWQSLISCYSRSPFFEFYEDRIKPFYIKKYDYLLEFNLDYFNVISSILKRNITVHELDRYYKSEEYHGNDFRNFILPRNARIEYFPEYTQVFNDRMEFKPELCVLDLIFNTGNQSATYLDKIVLKF